MVNDRDLKSLERLDLFYRSLCSMVFNYAPTSGHPGGSISAGRILSCLLFHTLDYDLRESERPDADLLCFAAGHKALGLYAMWALRDEVARISAPDLLASSDKDRLRLEDLLGFRRNPITETPLFEKFRSKALDGHPTPATPFVPIATGASGVGFTAAVGLALGAKDIYGSDAPRIHVIEGEAGLTPGRVAEAMAAAATANLGNLVLHIDWNQSSIDSDQVCAENGCKGDYVQWTPAQLAEFEGWHVIEVKDGSDFPTIFEAQMSSVKRASTRPTAIIYRTVKGWRYGVEGRGSHGSGHGFCSEGFYSSLSDIEESFGQIATRCESRICTEGSNSIELESCYWKSLLALREVFEGCQDMTSSLAKLLKNSSLRLDQRKRRHRDPAPRVERVFHEAERSLPEELRLAPGTTTTLRYELGRTLGHLNAASSGAFFIAAADLLGSTSAAVAGDGFPSGLFNASSNPQARLIAVGGICEDAISGVMSGLASFGYHIGVAASYGAFLAPLAHISARLHAIGATASRLHERRPAQPIILVLAHAGLKTGEDGPTHADPQALQLFQENFPSGTSICLTPWDPQEIWPLLTTAFKLRSPIIVPVVTRPAEKILDRSALGLAPVKACRKGIYALRKAQQANPVNVILQGSEVTYEFIDHALPRLLEEGIDISAYSIASSEIYDQLTTAEQEDILPEGVRKTAMGITGFTKATMYRWITSERGRKATLHPFKNSHFLGSGSGAQVLREAGLDGFSQYKAIRDFARGE